MHLAASETEAEDGTRISHHSALTCRSSTRSTDNERNRDRGRDRERDRDRQDSFGWEDAGTSRRYRTNSWSEGRDRENTRSQEWPRDYRDRYR